MIPIVSVIITVYKRTQYIKQAIQSVLDQTFTNFEIIVTDDSNNKEIESICNSFQDVRLRYRTNKENIGVALNVKIAIQESKGKYIAILNDDDSWETTFLEKLVLPLEADDNLVLSFSNHWIIDEVGVKDIVSSDNNSNKYGRKGLPEGKLDHLENFVLMKNGVPLAMAAVFRKDGINLELVVKEVSGAYDFWISCLLASTNRPAYFIPEKLTQYRIHSDMETVRKAPDKNENLIFIYKSLIDLNLFPEKQDYFKLKYSQMLRHVGIDNMVFGQSKVARTYLKKSLQCIPSIKTAAILMISFLPNSVIKYLNK